jgi:hypothetical protein
MRVGYKWLRTKIDSYSGSGTDKTGHAETSLRNLKGSHKTSISGPKTLSRRHDVDDDHDDEEKAHFVRLD